MNSTGFVAVDEEGTACDQSIVVTRSGAIGRTAQSGVLEAIAAV